MIKMNLNPKNPISIFAYGTAYHSETLEQHTVYNLRFGKENYYLAWLVSENYVPFVMNNLFISKLCSNQQNSEIKLGKYQHYKSANFYQLLGLSHLIQNIQDPLQNSLFVLYRALYTHEKYGKDTLWLRPKEMFFETVYLGDNKVPRFNYISIK
mgnify:FL=1